MLSDIPKHKVARLWKLLHVGVISLVLSYGLTAVTIEFGIVRRNPDWSTEKAFDDFDDPYKQIIDDTIPFVQQWFRGLNVGDDLLSSVLDKPNSSVSDPASCIDPWVNDLNKFFPQTTPYMIELILDNLGLREHHSVRGYLADYLESPQSLVQLFNQTTSCLTGMQGLAEFACYLRENNSWDLENPDQLIYLSYSVHLGVVLQVLTSVLPYDVALLTEIAETMKYERLKARMDHLHTYYAEANLNFQRDKFQGVAKSLGAYAYMISKNVIVPSIDEMMPINLLEAVKLDVINGHSSNARMGTALAATAKPGIGVGDMKMVQQLGKPWVDTYHITNSIFIIGSRPYYLLPKLFIPAVTCEITQENQAEGWLAARLISLALVQMLVPSLPSTDVQAIIPSDDIEGLLRVMVFETRSSLKEDRYATSEGLAKVNLETSMLTSPSRSTVEHMLFNICGGFCYDDTSWKVTDTAPPDWMSEKQFRVFVGFIMWFITIVAGLGLEFFVWVQYLQRWCEQREFWWKFAQFVFPVLLVTVLGLALNHNFLALPLMVVSLWKFGFPETIMYTYLGMFNKHSSRLERASDLLNGIGLLIHHSASVFIVCMLLSGVVTYSRYILSSCLMLGLQHLFVLLKYVSEYAYIVVELFLELWFEWLIISEFWYIYRLHWTMALGAGVMLIAHWFFLIASTLVFFSQMEPETETNVHIRGTTSFRRRSTIKEVPRSEASPEGLFEKDGSSTVASVGGTKRRRSSLFCIDEAVLGVLEDEEVVFLSKVSEHGKLPLAQDVIAEGDENDESGSS